MKKAISLTAVLGFVLYMSLTVSGQAQGKSKGGAPTACGVNVTSTLDNSGDFQIQSDGLDEGSYTTYSAHKDSVSSILRPDCSWMLDTTDSLSREIAVSLEYPYNGGPSAPFTGQTVKGVINSHCSSNSANQGVDIGSMTPSDLPLICPINIAFYVGSVWYNIAINPYNWPNTSQTLVTCATATAGVCSSWTVAPDSKAGGMVNPATTQMSAIGELTRPSCVGCSDGTGLGLYYVSFSFVISR